jgi:hypothetical protein
MDEDLNFIISQMENPAKLNNSEMQDFLFEIKNIIFRKPLAGERIVNCLVNTLINYREDLEIVRLTLQILSSLITIPEGDSGCSFLWV